MPVQSLYSTGLESPPQSKPPLPPKPARLYRKLSDVKPEDHSMEDDDTDDDDEDDDDLEGSFRLFAHEEKKKKRNLDN